MNKHTNRPNSIVIPPSMRHSTHADDIERLEVDMAAYLVKGGTIKPAVSAPRVTITERQRKVKI